MLDVWKPEPGSFRPASDWVQSRAHTTHAVLVMVDFREVQPDLNVDPGFAQPAHPRFKLVPSAQRLRMNVHAPFTRTALTPPPAGVHTRKHPSCSGVHKIYPRITIYQGISQNIPGLSSHVPFPR
eukprot:6535530-Prymnesium_polylepis.1